MERLTEEKQIGPWASLKDKAEAIPGAFANYDCLMAHMTAVTRLKAYEDTGLEPEEIREVQEAMAPIPFSRFRDIMEAERDSRLVVLPCKVGDTVFVVHEGNIMPGEIDMVTLGYENTIEYTMSFDCHRVCLDKENDGCRFYDLCNDYFHMNPDDDWGCTSFGVSDIGKTVFLTSEEAERALEEM